MNDPIVIVSAARTPIGGLLGDFASLQAYQLGGAAIRAAVERAGITGEQVDEVLMGNCLMAGQGQAPARQACARRRPAAIGRRGHAVEDVRLGHARDDVRARHAGRRQRRRGGRRRHGEHDQRAAPACHARKGVTLRRTRRCTTTWRSTAWKTPTSAARRWACSPSSASPSTASRARRRTSSRSPRPSARSKANEDGSFAWEIAPVHGRRQGRRDRGQARRAAVQGQARQDPGAEAGVQEGRHDHRRHSSSSISDGAAALVLMRESTADKTRLQPIARIVAHAVHAQAPEWFTTAPVGAIEKVLKKAGWSSRRRRPVGGQRGVRRGDDGGDGASSGCRTRSSTSTAARARSAIRSAPPARASSSRCSARCARPAASAASRRCASAAAKRPRWRSSCCSRPCSARTISACSLVTALVLNATPGVDMLLTLTRTLQDGLRAGIAAALGISCGCVVHALPRALRPGGVAGGVGARVHVDQVAGRGLPALARVRHVARGVAARAR